MMSDGGICYSFVLELHCVNEALALDGLGVILMGAVVF